MTKYYKLTWKMSPNIRYVKVDDKTIYMHIKDWNCWHGYATLKNKDPEQAVIDLLAPSIASFDALYVKEIDPDKLALELFQ